jgi:hypothetical protein
MTSLYWMIGLFLVAIYCVAQSVRDFRRGDYAWAAAAGICAAILLLTPIQTHAVKLDLPAPTAG